MNDDPDNNTEDLHSTRFSRTAAALRADLKIVTNEWRSIRANLHKILQAETWLEIFEEIPKRVKVSAVLIPVLVLAVWWGSTLLTPAQKEAIRVALPYRLASGPPPTATATPTPVSLQSAEGQAAWLAATPTPAPLFVFHTVKSDETLLAIAAQYNITTESLLVANNIRDPSQLHAGQHLLVPPQEGRIQQKIVVHDVKEGETLLSIATKYGSSVMAIQEANPNLTDQNLPPGEAVAVPIVFEDPNLAKSSASDEIEFHTIQPGEYPLSIAAQYDIPVEILLSVNNITDATRLQVGDVLQIPPHEGLSLGYPVILYELTATDTLVGIASRFGSSVKDILAVNPELDPLDLSEGQLVAVPVIFAPRKAPAQPSVQATSTPAPPPPINRSLTEQMAQGINAERAARNLPPYQFDMDLAAVALGHAQDMVVRDFVAHTNPDGTGPKDRVLAGGIDNAFRMGENIQINSQPESSTVAAAIEWFMNSPPHRAGILNQYYNSFGAAAVQNPAGWYYYVIVFAQRQG